MFEHYAIIDVSGIAHRAFHSVGHLSHDDKPTGTAWGTIAEAVRLLDKIGAGIDRPVRPIWVFDHPAPKLREKLLPTYKHSRKTRHAKEDEDPDKKLARKQMRMQVTRLYKRWLPAMGYANVWAAKGYEADDLIAAFVAHAKACNITMVTSDEDMWQCLRSGVAWLSPTTGKLVRAGDFRKTWGLEPCQWADVKAWAGCSGDDVPGIPGVGEIKAAEYLTGKMNPKTKTYKKIIENHAIHLRNLPLVRLPFEGCVVPPVQPDNVTAAKWAKVMRELGAKLAPPQGTPTRRRKRKGAQIAWPTIVAGSRDYTLTEKDKKLLGSFNISRVVCGGARGADAGGRAWAEAMGVPVDMYPADWDKHGKGAGYIRNVQMADNAKQLVAFWDGKSRGTQHMIKTAKKKGLRVKVVRV